ncbi:hypothetical protein [Enterococcus olivae]
MPKPQTLSHIKSNAKLDFEIFEKDMNFLKAIEPIKDYEEAHVFPVFSEGISKKG